MQEFLKNIKKFIGTDFLGKIGLKNYSRIDVFVNIKTEQIIIIEANTLPAMTPSTVIFHQALAEENPLTPREFIELLIENSK